MHSTPISRISAISAGILLVILLGTLVSAATLSTTTMTWVVAANKSITVAYGSPCSSTAFFFVESNAQWDSDADGNWARALPQSTRIGAGDTNCQSSSQAAMTVTNAGNVTVNLDANFTTAMTGADINLELKVWMGTGSGCGTNGLGGYQEPCTITGVTTPVTQTACREFSSSSPNAATAGQRLVTSLAVNDTNQLCYAGDLNAPTGGTTGGDHNKTFQIGSEFS